MSIKEKYTKLTNILKEMRSALVAFSGGVDSTLLLKVAKDSLGDSVFAVIANSETYPDEEILSAENFANFLNIPYQIINTEELSDERFLCNPKERCYFCKIELFSKLKEIAKLKKMKFVVDGSNVSDKDDFRPGSKAKEELGVRSPLAEAGFTKDDIRELSKELGLKTWDKPSLACLSSRIPYGTRITKDVLERIGKAEKFIRELGFTNVRVRHHNHIARIEIGKEETQKVFEQDLMDIISKKLESIGYTYITLDLKGFRTGSMNEVLQQGGK